VWLDFLLLGIILLAVLLYRPKGIFVEKPTPTISMNSVGEASGFKKIFNFFFK